MHRPLSLTFRLTLLFGIVAIAVLSAFGWIIEDTIEQHFISEDTEELNIIAHAVSQVLSDHKTNDDPTILQQRFGDILIGHHGALLHVTDMLGKSLFSSQAELNLAEIISTNHELFNNNQTLIWSAGEHAFRIMAKQSSNSGDFKDVPQYNLVIAVAIDEHQRFIDEFSMTLRFSIFTGVVLMSLFGWAAVRKGHAPLHDIVEQIHKISANDLNTRLSPESVPKELASLSNSFNEMLGRMEEAFQRLSNFSADIAHELRTPITNLLTQTQVALSHTRSVNDYQETLYSNIEEYERIAKMIGDMLFLAKTDNGLFNLDVEYFKLSQEVLDLFEFYDAWAEECEVSLAVEGEATILADRIMFRRALSNLLSNAIKHTPPGNVVRLKINQSADQMVSITVENPGPTIPPEHIPRLFDRFHRVDDSRNRKQGDGAGLGLAITKSIIDIHAGKIEANSNNNITQFRISVPAFALI